MRGSLLRTTIVVLIALLAWPGAVTGDAAAHGGAAVPAGDERPIGHTGGDGMATAPARATVAEVSAVPAPAVPLAALIHGSPIAVGQFSCQTARPRPSRSPVSARPAPTVLRL